MAVVMLGCGRSEPEPQQRRGGTESFSRWSGRNISDHIDLGDKASETVLTQGKPGTSPARKPLGSGGPPNILVIMTDDVGIWNIGAYHRGMMGNRTPNIDRIADEGALLTDYYAQQSCTAGRAAFILGQTPFRTGLLKVGMPAAKQGVQDSDPTIAELLKPHGYATAQIGKNHLGDRNQYLPTVHGFDEFYGILYHLNAMEDPYEDDFPKDPAFHEKFGPRNIVETRATNKDDSTTDPRWGRVGKQTIADGGPLPPGPNMDPKAKVDMTNVDEELVRRSNDFMERSVKAGTPFFLWHNSTRTHVWTCEITDPVGPFCHLRVGDGQGGLNDERPTRDSSKEANP